MGTLPKVGMLLRNATLGRCIFGAKALHRTTHRPLLGLGRLPTLDTRQGNRSLRGCFKGKGVSQDYAKAAHWLQMAARGWNPRAQMYLGSLYEQGKGVPLHYVTAYMWYDIAASGGDQRANGRLRILSRVMTKEQINRAETLSRELSIATPRGKAVEQSQGIGNAFNREP